VFVGGTEKITRPWCKKGFRQKCETCEALLLGRVFGLDAFIKSNYMYLKSFLFSDTPEMIEMINFIINTIQNDHRKETIVQSFIK
jgi:hypothetical protein